MLKIKISYHIHVLQPGQNVSFINKLGSTSTYCHSDRHRDEVGDFDQSDSQGTILR